MAKISRRDFGKLIGSTGAMSALGVLSGCATEPEQKQTAAKKSAAAPKVVIVGGGFGGATCAKYLRVYDSGINVTLIEPNSTYTTCPGSNWVIGGLYKMDDLAQSYGALRNKHGVNVVHDRVASINADKRTVTLSSGKTIEYDRLVL